MSLRRSKSDLKVLSFRVTLLTASLTMQLAKCDCHVCVYYVDNVCERRKRVELHGETVWQLYVTKSLFEKRWLMQSSINLCSDTVILKVGPNKVIHSCHKAALGYYSEFFRAALFGQFQESSGQISLPDDDPNAISSFIGWVYTGALRGGPDIELEQLWILGDKFMAFEFENEVMQAIFDKYSNECLLASTAEYVYDHTPAGSTLRCLMADMISSDGPLRFENKNSSKEYDDWMAVIRRGGEMVLDQIAYGFQRHSPYDYPARKENELKYLIELSAKSPVTWYQSQFNPRSAATAREGSPSLASQYSHGVSIPSSYLQNHYMTKTCQQESDCEDC